MMCLQCFDAVVGRQEGHPACKKQWWGAGVVICLERGADLHTAQLMPLPLTASSFSKIQIGFTFLVPAVVICLERGADLHTAQLMPLPLTVSCFSKIQIGFTCLSYRLTRVVLDKGPLNVCVCGMA